MSHPTVSVIIPSYNYARFVGEAIESVFAQTLPVHEVIVVDDGSTDDTPNVLARYKDRIQIIQQKNRGVAAARNAGVNLSTGEFICFLDADDVWLPNKLEREMSLMMSDPEIGLVHCAMREFDPEGKTVSTFIRGIDGWAGKELLLLQRSVVGPGSTALVRRQAFKAIRGFDENKDLHPSEDWEFAYRLSRKYKIAFLPELLVEYRNHGVNGHLNVGRMERGMMIAFRKAFTEPDEKVQELRRIAYANLHKMLAGSYFTARNYSKFIEHMLKSSIKRPANLFYFATFPLRAMRRIGSKAKDSSESVSPAI